MSDEKRLGRGIESLLGPSTAPVAERLGEVIHLQPKDIKPNPYQPRDLIPEEGIGELAASLKESGMIQPVVVRRTAEGYELISGERRLRAAALAGMPTIPAIVRQANESDMLTIALVENLQRSDLNPIEKAKAFVKLSDRFQLTQEDVSKRLGLSRSSVANFMRLLDLPAEVQQNVSRGTISMSHARTLLTLDDPARQLELAQRITKEDLSVRQVERLVSRAKIQHVPVTKPVHVTDLENRIRQRLGCKVEVTERDGSGKVTFYFANPDDLDRILELIGA